MLVRSSQNSLEIQKIKEQLDELKKSTKSRQQKIKELIEQNKEVEKKIQCFVKNKKKIDPTFKKKL